MSNKQNQIELKKGLSTLALAVMTMAASLEAEANIAMAGCTQFSELPAGASPSIATQGSAYTPKCLRIKKGTSVTIEGSARHPLQGIVVSTSSVVNPIYDELGGAVETKSFTFNDVGVFGYFCVAHGNDQGQGMAGAIEVVE